MKRRAELIHTYSIIAIDKERGEMGGAVQSHYFSVGGSVIWAQAGTGVIATQAMVNIEYGPQGLSLLKKGFSSEKVINLITSKDSNAPIRQVAALDCSGGIQAFTGSKTITEAGHIVGENYSCQANMMLKNTVWSAMAQSFEESSGPLAERLLISLEAAEAEGGDIRGKQSSALTVVSVEDKGNIRDNIIVDLRVEDHSEPLGEMRRLLTIHKAYTHAALGDLAIEKGDISRAMDEFAEAEKLIPENIELQFWKAVSLINHFNFSQAEPILKKVFRIDNNWKILLQRLTGSEIIKRDEEIQKFLDFLCK
ncbi:MAG: DUF1028 domain-containing protein [Spirochaetaceae bacterium]|nr:DUF1028 domain-containing protein [Spirochaetaceae bacterium]